MKEEIIKLLKENTSVFISGQYISEKLGVSRTAVWKYINQMREEGYEIESVSSRGYKLALAPDLLSYEEIEPYLSTKRVGRKLIHFDSLGSTNTEAKRLAELPESDGMVVIAEQQSSGRGRLGKSWVSPKNKGIWMSIILKPALNPMEAVKLTQIAAASVVVAASELNIKTLVKWPNDIVINHKKACGILTEMSAELTQINYIIVGIGINVNIDEKEFPEELRPVATSLKSAVNHSVNRKELVGRILNNFELLYYEFLNTQSIKASIDICRTYSAVIGKEIYLVEKGEKTQVTALGMDDDGRLLVEYKDGKREYIISGEISIRGKESYI